MHSINRLATVCVNDEPFDTTRPDESRARPPSGVWAAQRGRALGDGQLARPMPAAGLFGPETRQVVTWATHHIIGQLNNTNQSHSSGRPSRAGQRTSPLETRRRPHDGALSIAGSLVQVLANLTTRLRNALASSVACDERSPPANVPSIGQRMSLAQLASVTQTRPVATMAATGPIWIIHPAARALAGASSSGDVLATGAI